MYDVMIIGGGISGCTIARELSRYKANVCLLEKGDDVASGTSKVNGGAFHAGYDPKPGTMMARMNVRGNELVHELADVLDYPAHWTGAMVVCIDPEERYKLDTLYEQGVENGVPDLRILEKDEVLEMEPNLSQNVVAALYAPTAGYTCPMQYTIAFAESAAINGVEFRFETKVTNIIRKEDHYILETTKGNFETRAVVNAAGLYADEFHNMMSSDKIHITPRKGEYLLLDKPYGETFKATIMVLPGKMGKGVLTAPTIHGNLYVGPTSYDIEDKEGVNTTREYLDSLLHEMEHHLINEVKLPASKIITSFAGLRAHEDGHDFIVKELPEAPLFFEAAGIESPGLTSAPAIAEYLVGLISQRMELSEKSDFIPERKNVVKLAKMTMEERNALIKEKPEFGQIICRCEMITEGEIVDAINRPVGATSLDGVKRRVRAGMGRCQGGFCTPKVMQILARELGRDMTEITKKGHGSEMLVGKIKMN
ncbi:MAG: NAD(P)/FAD-dependent oxidoreductase [Eubacterium sp.]|nr:NAD(P)/FAD-dependent oxidoreductase [Eubacterium sp.]